MTPQYVARVGRNGEVQPAYDVAIETVGLRSISFKVRDTAWHEIGPTTFVLENATTQWAGPALVTSVRVGDPASEYQITSSGQCMELTVELLPEGDRLRR